MVYLLLPMFEKLKDGEQDLQYLFMFPILSLRQKQPYEVYTKSELKARLLYTTGSLITSKEIKKTLWCIKLRDACIQGVFPNLLGRREKKQHKI